MEVECDNEPLGYPTFREHNKEADLWADKGAKGACGRVGGHDPISPVSVGSGTGAVIVAYSDLHGSSTFNKKCGLVPREQFLECRDGRVWYADG